MTSDLSKKQSHSKKTESSINRMKNRVPLTIVSCKCTYKCKTLSAEQCERLFTQFNKLSHEEQGTYPINRIDIIPVSRRRHGKYDDPADSKRQVTMLYTVPGGDGLVQVCAKTFREIFGIANRRVQTINEKKKSRHISFKDGCGKQPSSHKHKFKYKDEDWKNVKEHILSFPREESHYGRAKSTKEYLSSDLNISRMYHSFKETYPQYTYSYRFYQKVFRKSFPNLSFGKPRVDTCAVCDRLNNKIKIVSNSAQQFPLRTQLALYQKKAQKALETLRKSIHDSQLPLSDTCCISMDLQQVLFCPTLTHSNMFNSRQLSNYNFCIHVGDNSNSYMSMWHEAVASWRGNEIASCILKVLSSNITTKRQLEIWSDNCAGQNKNKMILVMLMYLVAKGVFDTINLKFLVTGHSYMPCARDFGIIEKRKKVCKAMVPEELQEVVRSARIKNPFRIIEMTTEDFYDFGQVANTYINTSRFKISKVTSIQISKNFPDVVKSRQSYGDIEEWRQQNIFKKGMSLNSLRMIKELPRTIQNVNISTEKKKDLLIMLDYMDVKYHEFYKNICK